VKNNSTDRVIERFYIDHSADSSHNGYLITTDTNCVKSVMGFSRYHFTLEPQQQIEFLVSEEACYKDSFSSTTELINTVKNRFSIWENEGLIDGTFIRIVKDIITHREAIQALQNIINDSYNERAVIQWKTGSSVSTPQLIDGKLHTTSLVPKSLMDKIEIMLDSQSKKRDGQRLLASLKDSIQKIFVNQNRLRENIKILEKWNDSELVKRYLSDFDVQEDVLNNTNRRIGELEAEEARKGEGIQHLKNEIANDAKRELEHLGNQQQQQQQYQQQYQQPQNEDNILFTNQKESLVMFSELMETTGRREKR